MIFIKVVAVILPFMLPFQSLLRPHIKPFTSQDVVVCYKIDFATPPLSCMRSSRRAKSTHVSTFRKWADEKHRFSFSLPLFQPFKSNTFFLLPLYGGGGGEKRENSELTN